MMQAKTEAERIARAESNKRLHVAQFATKGERKIKHMKRMSARINAWANPEGKLFKDRKDEGGAKCPGSWQ